MMADRPRKPPVAGLRRLLLAAMVLGALGLVATFFVGRSRQVGSERRAGTAGGAPSGDITVIGQGFEYTQTDKGRKVFRLRGDSLRIRSGNQVLLDGVGLTLYDEAGIGYDVVARQATYDQNSHDAELEGGVRLTGPRGMELATEELLLHGGGKVADSGGAVAFRYADAYAGRADRLRFHLPKDHLYLGGEVRIDSLPGAGDPMSLAAGTLVLERDRHQVRAERGVELRRGGDLLRAQRLSALLSDDDKRLEFVRARWLVSGELGPPGDDGGDAAAAAAGGEPTRTAFRCTELSAVFASDGRSPRRVELEGGAGEPLVVETTGSTGRFDTLTAGYAVATLRGQQLAEVEAFGGARLVEAAAEAPAQPLREVAAERLSASFAAGGALASVDAEGGVEYRSEGTAGGGGPGRATLSGERLSYDAAAGRGEFFGAPVKAVSARGELVAPHAVWEEKAGLLSVDGGVRALLADSASAGLAGSPLAPGEGPVRVEAREAFWRDQPPAFLFRGDVRAWQGESLLVAASLRGDRAADGSDELTAGGGVKTLWTPAPAAVDGAPTAAAPIEVTAAEMLYRKAVGTLAYRGGARAEQEGRTLTCRDLDVELDADGRARSLTCTGDVRLDDRAAGTSARGERAVYDFAARTVDLAGAPVELRKGDGTRIEGRRVVYDLDGGRARVLSGGPNQGEAPAPGAAGGGG